MFVLYALGLALSIAHAAASNTTSKTSFDGWYPCSEYTFSDEGTSSGQKAECAIYSAPLCYPGVCDDPNSIADIFVKRLPATVGNVDTASNVWLLKGGPGSASTDMEYMMVEVHSRLNGTVNVYTMDHRGTGCSTMLDCGASQATATGSPRGADIDITEVAACAKALGRKYTNFAAFSITSTATDLKTLISEYSNGASTIVYGVSYGTAVDGISTTWGASAEKFEYFSTWEIDFGEVGDYFLSLCPQDSECNSRFGQKSLSDSLQDLLTQFDNEPNSTCTTLVSNQTSSWGSETPSFKLRKALGTILTSLKKRTLIPPLVYRLQRCTPNDVDVVTTFFKSLDEDKNYTSQSDIYLSNPLNYLIMFSEMWESPAPSVAEMNARFQKKSPMCDELGVNDYASNAIIYEHDQYWSKSATIPNNASVLLLSSKLDAQTPHKVLEGDNKELVTFEHVIHGVVAWSFLDEGDYTSETCGMKMLVPYVSSGGDLASVDKSCLDEMPPFNLTTPIDYRYLYMSAHDAYDGIYNASLRKEYV